LKIVSPPHPSLLNTPEEVHVVVKGMVATDDHSAKDRNR
jgi:hypothetical protein